MAFGKRPPGVAAGLVCDMTKAQHRSVSDVGLAPGNLIQLRLPCPGGPARGRL
jgi:hypothetical protein